MTQADIIIIGAGPGGYETAARAVADGRQVVIIERDNLGGTCLNRGCIPTKALCASAATVESLRHCSEFGIVSEGYTVDFGAMMARKDAILEQLRQGVATTLSGATVVAGEASFTPEGHVAVNGEKYKAPMTIIATGSRPSLPPVEGADTALTSDDLLSLKELPESLVIIGGGVIGMEFASVFTSLDVKVTVIEYCKEIIPPLDAEVAKRLRMALKKRGIEIITSAQVTKITRSAGIVTVDYTEKGKQKAVTASEVAIATGRKAVVPDGFAEAGGNVDARGFIVTSDDFSTSIPGVYAIGDVNGRCMLAHAATAQGFSLLGAKMNLDVIPSAVFTMPECGMVGLTEERCKTDGIDYVIGKSTFRANGKAVASGETDGLVKVIAEAGSKKILGCHICGPHAADLIQEMTVAVASGLTADDLRGIVHPHPTLSETLAAALP